MNSLHSVHKCVHKECIGQAGQAKACKHNYIVPYLAIYSITFNACMIFPVWSLDRNGKCCDVKKSNVCVYCLAFTASAARAARIKNITPDFSVLFSATHVESGYSFLIHFRMEHYGFKTSRCYIVGRSHKEEKKKKSMPIVRRFHTDMST